MRKARSIRQQRNRQKPGDLISHEENVCLYTHCKGKPLRDFVQERVKIMGFFFFFFFFFLKIPFVFFRRVFFGIENKKRGEKGKFLSKFRSFGLYWWLLIDFSSKTN